ELLEGAQKLRVNLVEARLLSLLPRRAVVDDVLIIHFRVLDVRPVLRLRHLQPLAEGLQTELKHPLRLALLLGDEADGVFGQPPRNHVRLDVGDEAVLVLLVRQQLDCAHRMIASCALRRYEYTITARARPASRPSPVAL